MVFASWLIFSLLFVTPTGAQARAPVSSQVISGAFDQNPNQESFRLKVNVDLVTVEAVVRNSRGDVIGGLHADDFILLDNGVAQRISHFSLDELPLAVALVIDCSGSISPYISELRSAALSALSQLKLEDQVVLYSFGTCPTRRTELTADRSLIADEIGNLKVEGSTNVLGAIRDAARFLHYRAQNRRHAIIVISDNYENMMLVSEETALREALEAGVVVYSLQTRGQRSSAGDSRKPIEKIVKETGGEIMKLGNEKKLSEALQAAIRNLRQGYTLGFTPSSPGKETSYHRLEVRLAPQTSCRGCRVSYRTGYYAVSRASSPRQSAFTEDEERPCNSEMAFIYHQIEKAPVDNPEGQDIRFHAKASGRATVERGQRVTVDLRIEISGIDFHIEGDRHAADLVIAFFAEDAAGKYVGDDWKNVELRLRDETYRQYLKTGIPFFSILVLKSQARTIKAVIYDMGGNKLGACRVAVIPSQSQGSQPEDIFRPTPGC